MKLFMKSLILFFTALGILFASPVFSAPKKADAKKVNAKKMAAKKVDIKNSTFKWTGTKKIGEKHYGSIVLKSAQWQEKKGKFEKATFVMDMASFTVDDLTGKWEKKFIGHVKNEDFFEVKKYPIATLVLDKKTKTSAKGMLTIKDKTHPISISFTQKKSTYMGTMTFDRTKFGIIYNSSNYFAKLAADRIINNEVTVEFKVILK